tara:strand:+ start:617 stop:1426 length:810 start_codon:yes stop_codon:yes gene_type:complete
MPFKKNIVFVGDSFCSSWRGYSAIPHQYLQQHDDDPSHVSWLDVAAAELELNLYSFGFAGRSWYYSRIQLFDHMQYDPSWIESVDLMVFCHTNSQRYNTANGNIGVEMLDINYQPHPDDAQRREKIDTATSLKRWAVDLIDNPYQEWAQHQWFHEIARTFKDVKQIHFNNYTFSVDSSITILPGVVYTTPLIHISLGEATGTDSEIIKNFMSEDQRANHFNSTNNTALGQLVAETAQNYNPGAYKIDMNRFEIVNPNSTLWPNPGFGLC